MFSLVHTSKLDFLCNSFLHPHRLSTNSTTNSNQLYFFSSDAHALVLYSYLTSYTPLTLELCIVHSRLYRDGCQSNMVILCQYSVENIVCMSASLLMYEHALMKGT